MRVPKTLYIIADGGRVRYVERTGPGQFSTFRKFVSAHMHAKASELARDRPGRVRESVGTTRHAIAAKIDPRDKVETAFIRAIAEDLREDGTIGGFDNLVLIAPGKLQNVFYASLSPALAARLVKCIDKDLTKVPDGDLYRHLPVLLASHAPG
jgi:protein required for attachment to host cells